MLNYAIPADAINLLNHFCGNTGVEPCPFRLQRNALSPRALLPFSFLVLWVCPGIEPYSLRSQRSVLPYKLDAPFMRKAEGPTPVPI